MTLDRSQLARLLGAAGGAKRVQNSTLEQRKAWGAKGGRPRKNKDLSTQQIAS